MMIVPTRVTRLEFAMTLKFTVALPAPLVGDVMVIHGFVLMMVHAQPASAVRFTEDVPAAVAKNAGGEPGPQRGVGNVLCQSAG